CSPDAGANREPQDPVECRGADLRVHAGTDFDYRGRIVQRGGTIVFSAAWIFVALVVDGDDAAMDRTISVQPETGGAERGRDRRAGFASCAGITVALVQRPRHAAGADIGTARV